MPTGRNNVSDAIDAARMGRSRSKPRLSRCDSPVEGRVGSWRGMTTSNANSAKLQKNTNMPFTLVASISKAPMSGPPVKPAISMPRNRPSRSAARDGSRFAASALMAGPAVPIAAPISPRATMKANNEPLSAKRADPAADTASPAMTKVFG